MVVGQPQSALPLRETSNIPKPLIQEVKEFPFLLSKGKVIMFTGAVGASAVPTGAPATGITDEFKELVNSIGQQKRNLLYSIRY